MTTLRILATAFLAGVILGSCGHPFQPCPSGYTQRLDTIGWAIVPPADTVGVTTIRRPGCVEVMT